MAIIAEKAAVEGDEELGGGAGLSVGADESMRDKRLVLLSSMEGAALEDCI